MTDKTSHPAQGGCACGAVRFSAEGEPRRAGLCHCMTCRKAHAAAFNPFVVYAVDHVHITGPVQIWRSSPDYERAFCPNCGSRIFARSGDAGEIEVSLGSFDAPGLLEPQYECWVRKREPWLRALPVRQYTGNRPGPLPRRDE